MATELTMATWIVTYNDYSTVGGPSTSRVKVLAAYYAPDGHLVEFKDTDHQVVFALHAGIVSTIRRDGAATRYEESA